MARDGHAALPTLGFIGLGAMGGAMARTLLRAGYGVLGWDIDAARLAAAAEAGARSAAGSAEVVAQCDTVLTSLRSSAIWAEVAEEELVPSARPAQVFIDLGTVAPPETRRIAVAFAQRGAQLLDVPVSGGPRGSETGTLRMFAGGEREIFDRCLPILHALGDPARVVYCGPSGSGQVVKAVNQLAMGIADAAYIEAFALGVRAGAEPEAVIQGVGGDDGWRAHFARLARRIQDGQGDHCYIKFPELPYFLAEAGEKGIPMPITEALYAFGKAGDVSFRDNMNRLTISYWRELMAREREGGPQPVDGPVRRIGEDDE